VDHSLKIDTTQNVGITFQLASPGERGLSWFIDAMVKLSWILIVGEVFKTGAFLFRDGNWGLMLLIMLLPIAFYNILSELFLNGQSVGKAIVKIRVMKIDGTQAGLSNYLLRWVCGLFEFNLFAGLGLIIFFWNGKGQRIGDIFAGTTVVKVNKEMSFEETTDLDLPENYQPTFPQVTNLSQRDVEVIKEGIVFYRKYQSYKLLNNLAHKVANTLNVTTNLSQLDFLQVVVGDYNYYQQKEG
jgi:uncharacterized RDD family membrane protein YckC